MRSPLIQAALNYPFHAQSNTEIGKHFCKLVSNELGIQEFQYNPEIITRFRASVASMEKTGCVAGEPVCRTIEETGYVPEIALPQLLSIMLESYYFIVYETKKSFLPIETVLESLIKLIQLMYERRTDPNHTTSLLYTFGQLTAGNFLKYQISVPKHVFYLIWVKQADGSILAYIYNLGRGIEKYHRYHGYILPIILHVNASYDQLQSHITTIVNWCTQAITRADMDEAIMDQAIDQIYRSGSFCAWQNLPEFEQTTENCVIKNYLYSVRGLLLLLLNDVDQADVQYRVIFNGIFGRLESHWRQQNEKCSHNKPDSQEVARLITETQMAYAKYSSGCAALHQIKIPVSEDGNMRLLRLDESPDTGCLTGTSVDSGSKRTRVDTDGFAPARFAPVVPQGSQSNNNKWGCSIS